MKRLTFLLLTLLIACASAQETKPAPNPVRAQIAERFGSKVETRFDQPYAATANPKQVLDVFLPKTRSGSSLLPVVVYIHGGGWSGGSRDENTMQAAAMAASEKYAAVTIGYRLSAEAVWPAQIHDCKAAIRWIRGHAKELKLDTNRIAVMGGSAGGHLATMLGVTGGVKSLEGDLGSFTKESSHVTCVVNFCGPADLTLPLFSGPEASKDDPAVGGLIGGNLRTKLDVAKAASPVTYATKKVVPILTIHGTADARVSFAQAEALHAALKKAGASSLLVPIVNGTHGVSRGGEGTQRMRQFLTMHLLGEKSVISEEPITIAPPPVRK